MGGNYKRNEALREGWGGGGGGGLQSRKTKDRNEVFGLGWWGGGRLNAHVAAGEDAARGRRRE